MLFQTYSDCRIFDDDDDDDGIDDDNDDGNDDYYYYDDDDDDDDNDDGNADDDDCNLSIVESVGSEEKWGLEIPLECEFRRPHFPQRFPSIITIKFIKGSHHDHHQNYDDDIHYQGMICGYFPPQKIIHFGKR